VAGREGLERVVDLLPVSRADGTGVHDLSQAGSSVEEAGDIVDADFRDTGFTDLAAQHSVRHQRDMTT